MMSSFLSDSAVAKRRLLLIDEDGEHQKWLLRILRTLAGTVDVAPAARGKPFDDSYDLCLVNYDHLSARARTALLRSRGKNGAPPRLLFYSGAKSFEGLVDPFRNHVVTNLLGKEERVDAEQLIVTIQKLLRGDIFGLEKYFAWGVETFSRRMTRASERREVIGQAEAFAARLDVHPRIAGHFCTVVDEFITNAFYNAPTDGRGRDLFRHRSRTEDVVLPEESAVAVTFCSDGRYLGVSTMDSFGSLTRERILEYVAKGMRRGADQIDDKQGGAGLGLFFVFSLLSHFVVNISPGRRTEVIGLLNIQGSYRDCAAQSKSFNVFVQGPAGNNRGRQASKAKARTG